uniref:Uncharacterized protein n=1 Tax=Zonotrichia albicollis TaxID=44394 RepID=A0A8D2QKW3_ZONAL
MRERDCEHEEFVGQPWGSCRAGEGPTLAPMSRLLARSLLTWDSAMSARSSASSSSCCALRNLASLQLILQFPHTSLQLLQLLLAPFQGQLLSLIQPHLQVLDGLLHVLLHPLQMGTGVLLLLQLLCHHVHHPQVVALGLLHLLILLGQLALIVCLDLVELQLGPQDLSLLMLQRGLVDTKRN